MKAKIKNDVISHFTKLFPGTDAIEKDHNMRLHYTTRAGKELIDFLLSNQNKWVMVDPTYYFRDKLCVLSNVQITLHISLIEDIEFFPEHRDYFEFEHKIQKNYSAAWPGNRCDMFLIQELLKQIPTSNYGKKTN